ncbi:MAG: D-alanyl-D-alanine carboxypeptidase/D-alanyl-D-alanine-endopeptidase [Calditrichaceae bacterium]
MRLFYFVFLFLSIIFILTGCHGPSGLQKSHETSRSLQSQIDYLLSDPAISDALVAVYIESLDDGKVVFRQNEHKLFIPASNMKLYTTAAALVNLSPDYRFRTEFYTNSPVNDGHLEGDLVIKGYGDPAISGRFFENDILAVFRLWADSLKSLGIRHIDGNIVGDDSYFSEDFLGKGWNWDDEPFQYSAQTGALSLNNNCVDISVAPGDSVLHPVKIWIAPDSGYVKIVNRAATISRDSLSSLKIGRERAENVIVITGGLPMGSDEVKQAVTIEQPASFFLHSFSKILNEKNILFNGNIETGVTGVTDSHSLLFSYESPPLIDIINEINKNSNNFYAEQLLRVMGAEFRKKGSAEKGIDFVNEWVASIGIEPAGLLMYDGSGLSRLNLISPYSTATLLRHMYYDKNFALFYNSLPVAGVDGTLKKRMKGTAAEGNARAKTGFVSHTRNLAGYINDSTEKPYLFVIMVNNYHVSTSYVNQLQDRICVLLSNYHEDIRPHIK